MLRCAILDDYQNVALSIADWSPLASEVETVPFNRYIETREERIAALKDFDIIVAMRERTPFDAELIRALPRLKLLITTGMYNASFDMAAAEAQGIAVCGTASQGSPPAELTWALILALVRKIPEEAQDFRSGSAWQQHLSGDLAERRLGIIGLGKLGGRVARVGVAFDMDVVAWSRSLTEEVARKSGGALADSLDELLSTSDFVTIHVPLNDSTRGMIGARELSLMKKDAFLINTSRGPIVDEQALVGALNSGKLAGAGVDVYSQEPLPPDHPMRRAKGLIGTPHIGYVTESNYRLYYREAVEDIAAWLKGDPVRVVKPRK